MFMPANARRTPRAMGQIVTTQGLQLVLAEPWDMWSEPYHRGSRKNVFITDFQHRDPNPNP